MRYVLISVFGIRSNGSWNDKRELAGQPSYDSSERRQMMIKNITKENFQQEVIECETTVLLDFFASWCGPCKMIAPVLEEIAEERSDITVGKVNIDEELELAQEFKIMSVPTLLVMKHGQIMQKAAGAMKKEEILNLLVTA